MLALTLATLGYAPAGGLRWPVPPSACRVAHQPLAVALPPPPPPPSGALRVRSFAPTVPSPSRKVTPFEDRLEQLRELTAQCGHALVPTDHCDASLRRWVSRQRALRRQGSLSAMAIEELDAVGMVWDTQAFAWDARYESLVAFHDAHGHCNVPAALPRDPALPQWVARQRALHRQGGLSDDRAARLVALDFEFDPLRAAWEGRLREYAAAVATRSALGPALARWSSRQRKSYAEGKLSADRIEALEEITGWRWGGRMRLPLSGRRGEAPAASGRSASATAGVALGLSPYPRCGSAGRALLVSIGHRRERGGAEELLDGREALRSLGYTVTTVENPSASELRASLVAHRSFGDWGGHASSVVGLMAHGHDASIEGQDGRSLPLRSLFGELANSAAPALAGKPKIWLVQACRWGEDRRVDAGGGPPPRRAPDGAARERGADGGGLAHAQAEGSEVATLGFDVEGVSVGSVLLDAVGGTPSASSVADGALLSDEHDYVWGFATSAGSPAYRGAMFAALREVVEEHGCETSWLELLQHTNEKLCEWSDEGRPLPSMEISSTCRGAAFSPADLVDRD